jgi:septation ring formation regulator EzrA
LQRLAEKLHRESKHSEDSLNDLERRIQDEERRAETLHPFEAKRNCDALERALKTIEDNVHSLLRDAQALQDGRYANSENIYKR